MVVVRHTPDDRQLILHAGPFASHQDGKPSSQPAVPAGEYARMRRARGEGGEGRVGRGGSAGAGSGPAVRRAAGSQPAAQPVSCLEDFISVGHGHSTQPAAGRVQYQYFVTPVPFWKCLALYSPRIVLLRVICAVWAIFVCSRCDCVNVSKNWWPLGTVMRSGFFRCIIF